VSALDAETEPSGKSLRGQIKSLVDNWRAIADVRASILAIEVRQTGQTLSLMIGMAVCAACVAAATLVLIAILAMWWAVELGFSRPAALLMAVGFNLTLLVALGLVIGVLGRRIGFKHTRASLRS